MMKATFSKNGKNFTCEDTEVNSKHLESDGWVRTAPKVEVAKPVEVATIPAQPEVKRSPGRPRNAVPSVLTDGEI